MMLNQQGSSPTHIVYFQRNFFRLDQRDNRIRKVKVTFGGLRQPTQDAPEKFVIWQKGIGFRFNTVFKREEFCAMNVLEQDIPRPSRLCDCLLGGNDSRCRHYFCLNIVLVRDNRQVIVRLLEPKNSHLMMLQDTSMPEPAAIALQKVIKEYIGTFEQWSVEVMNCMGVEEQGDNVILAITRYSFSILKDDFVMLHTHTFKDNGFNCTFNPVAEILKIQIAYNMNRVDSDFNFQLFTSYQFRTHVGRIIESRINENWRSENGNTVLPSATIFTETTDNNFLRQIENIPGHLGSTGSANGHATIVAEAAQVTAVVRSKLTVSCSLVPEPDISPLPSPCKGVEPNQHYPNIADLIPEQGIFVSKEARKYLRSTSFPDLLTDEKYKNHIYVNESIESWEDHCRSRQDKTEYYRFYYNLGYVRSEQNASMRTKLKRRSQISEVLESVDFEVLAKHETWYDIYVKSRSGKRTESIAPRKNFSKGGQGLTSNVKWKKRSSVKFKADSCFYSTSDDVHVRVSRTNNDTYWNSDLCMTLQMILEHRVPNICETLDITFNQLKGVVFYMSLLGTPSGKNWKDLAELLGLSFNDVNIVEKFSQNCPRGVCSYAMPMEILLWHWKFLDVRGRKIVHCNHEELVRFLCELNRDDVLLILNAANTNDHIQTEEEFQTTHL